MQRKEFTQGSGNRLAIVQDKRLAAKVCAESVAAAKDMTEHLSHLREAFPDIAQAVLTAAAANSILG